MTTHALNTKDAPPEAGTGLTILRNLDMGLLAVALPAFLIAGWPIVGWIATAVAWVAQRAIHVFAVRRAVATGDRRAAVGVLGGTMIGRIWLIMLAVLAAGIAEREAGLAAALLATGLFTLHFMATLIVTPIEEARRA